MDGYTNVDALPLENADIVMDLEITPWNKFDDDSIDEILMVEVLEHITFKKTDAVLREIYRVLKPNGKVHIQVPDIREMMFDYWNGQICECVPHKPKDEQDAKARLDCPNCEGYGRVHPNRWLYAFLGAQKHPYDFHKNIFTPERMEEYLEDAGFEKIDFKQDPMGWKIKVSATK